MVEKTDELSKMKEKVTHIALNTIKILMCYECEMETVWGWGGVQVEDERRGRIWSKYFIDEGNPLMLFKQV
jgi:hypothetical protein